MPRNRQNLPRYLTAAVLLLCLVGSSSLLADTAAETTVIYSWPESMQDDERGHYPIQLLRLAIAKSGSRFVPRPSRRDLTQERTLYHLTLERGIDVVWTFTTPERERLLLPIRIPIDRGLLGWRLLLVAARDSDRFRQLPDASALKQLRSVQGHDWPDFPILQHNGFAVRPSAYYAGMFEMLAHGHVRYFPRSMTEIWPELETPAASGLAVSPKWVLHYPAPLYFFVNRRRTDLAAAIEQGLLAALDDGSMLALFRQHFSAAIARADLNARRVVELENPLLTAETPLDRREFWFRPERGW